ncbi:MAG: BlaI/MecI/CopY family transcriptional regulator [Candidatus Diapherotrites archaeon]|nr:BlaI/MecI/CopY family transcriptional regulator [Candidatus Diapherotrites archaeon]
MDPQILEDIGLTNAEIKVYIALLELGSSTAGPILDKTNLHNSVVHMTLNKLIDKGLVTYLKEGKRNNYQPTNPKHILDYIDQKKERFEKILPELLAKQGLSKEKPEVMMFRGIRGIREILFELLEAGGKEHHTIGSPLESVMMGDAFWIDYHQKRARKKIKAKLLFNESLREWTKKVRATGHYPHAEIKFYAKGFEPLSETIIRNDQIGILLWVEKPIGILVHNKELAESYEKYFQFLWDKAKN